MKTLPCGLPRPTYILDTVLHYSLCLHSGCLVAAQEHLRLALLFDSARVIAAVAASGAPPDRTTHPEPPRLRLVPSPTATPREETRR